ncbi:MAG: radical SAM protein [Flavobacteriales bacterium]|nr:radical SAM protein [Flavobacteriales bacterium]
MNKPDVIPTYKPDQIVKSCRKLEAGLRFGQEGVSACALGPFQSPIYWNAKEAASLDITKEMISEKRKLIFDMLNDDHSETNCKGCQMVYTKKYKDVDFSKLGHIDFSETSMCNIRCDYCYYTKADAFNKSNFDSLKVLHQFTAEDVVWDSAVDFGGGEPTILQNFDECLDYFKSRGTRVFLYTNAAKYSQAAYDGLVDGNISWLCVSLDCGTPSTYKATKLRDYFARVMENLFKYVEASKKGLGNVSVKYIFTENNCSDDDLFGFTYAMKALQPDKVWLTFDFEPTKGLAADSDDFGEFDYTKLVDAYVKLYLLMKSHGITPGHFEENHLSQVSRQGQLLLQRVRSGIEKAESKQQKSLEIPVEIVIEDIASFRLNPLQIKTSGNDFVKGSLKGKRVLLAPVTNMSVELIQNMDIAESNVIGFIDRDPILQGKLINEVTVYGYEDIENLNPDVILVAVAEQTQPLIVNMLNKYIGKTIQVLALSNGVAG